MLMALVTTVMAADTASAPSAGKTDWILGIIPILTPIIVSVIKWGAPKIPTFLLPVLCPLLGAALEIVLHFAGAVSTAGVTGAILGASGLWLRELIDQLGKLKTK